MKIFLFGVIISTMAAVALANSDSPYAGQEKREIKALSSQEIDDYLNGRGMGYAKAAELNHYPGPKHVLDLAEKLELSQDQKEKTQDIFDTMKTSVIALGTLLIQKEEQIDQQFVSGTINPTILKTLLSEAGELQTRIRYLHLAAHLEQKALLSPHQIQLYDKLRGYTEAHGDGHKHSH